ncbi:hypothetical protein ABW19_dt0204247 [Dactylella cylindrospora]|nr:hypothetical protein ABW19_dt0204247 [Dactylella cylindrospora]
MTLKQYPLYLLFASFLFSPVPAWYIALKRQGLQSRGSSFRQYPRLAAPDNPVPLDPTKCESLHVSGYRDLSVLEAVGVINGYDSEQIYAVGLWMDKQCQGTPEVFIRWVSDPNTVYRFWEVVDLNRLANPAGGTMAGAYEAWRAISLEELRTTYANYEFPSHRGVGGYVILYGATTRPIRIAPFIGKPEEGQIVQFGKTKDLITTRRRASNILNGIGLNKPDDRSYTEVPPDLTSIVLIEESEDMTRGVAGTLGDIATGGQQPLKFSLDMMRGLEAGDRFMNSDQLGANNQAQGQQQQRIPFLQPLLSQNQQFQGLLRGWGNQPGYYNSGINRPGQGISRSPYNFVPYSIPRFQAAVKPPYQLLDDSNEESDEVSHWDPDLSKKIRAAPENRIGGISQGGRPDIRRPEDWPPYVKQEAGPRKLLKQEPFPETSSVEEIIKEEEKSEEDEVIEQEDSIGGDRGVMGAEGFRNLKVEPNLKGETGTRPILAQEGAEDASVEEIIKEELSEGGDVAEEEDSPWENVQVRLPVVKLENLVKGDPEAGILPQFLGEDSSVEETIKKEDNS